MSLYHTLISSLMLGTLLLLAALFIESETWGEVVRERPIIGLLIVVMGPSALLLGLFCWLFEVLITMINLLLFTLACVFYNLAHRIRRW